MTPDHSPLTTNHSLQDKTMPKTTQNAPAPDHSGHRARLKAAYAQSGLASFAPHEAAELILYSLLPRRDVNALAHALTDPSGTLLGALSQSEADMVDAGLSPACAERFRALGGCVRAYTECRERETRPSPENARALTEKLLSRPFPTALFYGQDGRLAALCAVKGDLTESLSELIIRYDAPLAALVLPEGCALPENKLARAVRAAELLGARLTVEKG